MEQSHDNEDRLTDDPPSEFGLSTGSITSFADLMHLPPETPQNESPFLDRSHASTPRAKALEHELSKLDSDWSQLSFHSSEQRLPSPRRSRRPTSRKHTPSALWITLSHYLAHFHGEYIRSKRSSNLIFKTNVRVIALHCIPLLHWLMDIFMGSWWNLVAIPIEASAAIYLLYRTKTIQNKHQCYLHRYSTLCFLFSMSAWRILLEPSLGTPRVEFMTFLAPLTILLSSIKLGAIMLAACISLDLLVFSLNAAGIGTFEPIHLTIILTLILLFLIAAAANQFTVDTLFSLRRTLGKFKQLNRELEQTMAIAVSSNELKSQFLSNMSHELYTPLSGILGSCEVFSEFLAQQDKSRQLPSRKERSALKILESSALDLHSKINDILVFSKLETNDLIIQNSPFSVAQVIESVLEQLSPEGHHKGLEMMSDISSTVPLQVQGDMERFHQLLRILVDNAVKFTSDGFVKVLASQQKTWDDDEKVTLHLQVLDTGCGISQEYQTRLFQAFMQGDSANNRRHEGAGLGLAIARKLVLLLGGNIWVESEGILESGTLIHFTCEFTKCTKFGNAISKSRWWHPVLGKKGNPNRVRNKRVLVMDSNPITRRNTVAICTRLSLRVTHCEGLEQTLEFVKHAMEEEDDPYLGILIDADPPTHATLQQTLESMAFYKGKQVIGWIKHHEDSETAFRLSMTFRSASASLLSQSISPVQPSSRLSPSPLRINIPSDSPKGQPPSPRKSPRLRKSLFHRTYSQESDREATAVLYKPLNIPKIAQWALKIAKHDPRNLSRKDSDRASSCSSTSHRLSILVVDDNLINLKLECRMLEAMGHSATPAKSGKEALETFLQVGEFDVVFMDIFMPGMSGPEASELIREQEKQLGLEPTPIIAITANGTETDRKACLVAGMNGYLTKPATKEQLEEALREHCYGNRIHRSSSPTPLKILVVDDHNINLKLECRMLVALGHTSVPATSGEEAVELFRENCDFSLVLMDIFMPGMSGFEAATLIREVEEELDLKSVPIVAVTANDTESDRQKAFACGMNEYINKPVNAGKLESTIAKVISSLSHGTE